MSKSTYQAVNTPIPGIDQGQVGFQGSIARALMGVVDTLLLWQQRASERHHLRTLTDHQLRDIALKRSDIDSEARKPFWMV